MAATPSSSRATQRATAGWSAEECLKLDKYLRKEAAGDIIPPEKWESGFSRHSRSSIKAKRRHRLAEMQKANLLPSTFPKGSEKSKTTTQAQRELFNTIFSGLQGPSSFSSSSNHSVVEPLVQGKLFF